MTYIMPGTEVKFKKKYGAYEGVVKAVWIAESGVQYQIAFFINGELKEPYVPRIMFDPIDIIDDHVGFKISNA